MLLYAWGRLYYSDLVTWSTSLLLAASTALWLGWLPFTPSACPSLTAALPASLASLTAALPALSELSEAQLRCIDALAALGLLNSVLLPWLQLNLALPFLYFDGGGRGGRGGAAARRLSRGRSDGVCPPDGRPRASLVALRAVSALSASALLLALCVEILPRRVCATTYPANPPTPTHPHPPPAQTSEAFGIVRDMLQRLGCDCEAVFGEAGEGEEEGGKETKDS